MKKFFRNKFVIGTIAIIFALVLSFVVAPLYESTVNEKGIIAFMKNDVNAGESITPLDIDFREVGVYGLPGNVIKSTDEIENMYAAKDLVKGEMLISSKLAGEEIKRNNYLYELKKGESAISITVPSLAASVTDKVRAGDIVQVLYQEDDEMIIPKETAYVLVLAVSDRSAKDLGLNEVRGEDQKEEEMLVRTVTFLSQSYVQTERLAEIEKSGTAHIAICYRGESKVQMREYLNEQKEILEEIEEKRAKEEEEKKEKEKEEKAEIESDKAEDDDSEAEDKTEEKGDKNE